MQKQQKIEAVLELKEKLAKSKSLVLADYRGLTHQQLEQIKKGLKVVGAEFIVIKNTLLKKAADTKYQIPDTDLEGPSATLFSYEDEIAPLSVLAKFIKSFGLPKIKIGFINDKAYDEKQVLQIAALPSREVLMATLAAGLKSPIYGLHYALQWNLRKLDLILRAQAQK